MGIEEHGDYAQYYCACDFCDYYERYDEPFDYIEIAAEYMEDNCWTMLLDDLWMCPQCTKVADHEQLILEHYRWHWWYLHWYLFCSWAGMTPYKSHRDRAYDYVYWAMTTDRISQSRAAECLYTPVIEWRKYASERFNNE